MKHLLVLPASVAGTKLPISTTPPNPLYPTANSRQIPTCHHHTGVQCGLGLTRIIGELRKLGIKKISRQTVRNILKEEGIEPGPPDEVETLKLDQIEVKSYVGGLVKAFERKAA